MENVVLTIHLLVTLVLIGVVLMQRSEGGGLGIGGGGGAIQGRSAATALTRLTWILGIALFVTSSALTIIAAQNSAGSSVLDRIVDAPVREAPAEEGALGGLDSLLPPAEGDDAPLVPTAE